MKFEDMTDEQKKAVFKEFNAYTEQQAYADHQINKKQTDINLNQVNYEERKKGVSLPYLMWFFLSWSGIHFLIINSKPCRITAVLRPLTLVFIILIMSADQAGAYSTSLLVGWVVWCLSDLITIPFYIKDYNKKLSVKYGARYQ